MSAPDDNYAIHKVSLKRTRQACGPCRHKKARCPGEKPICSLCQRLGQSCTYGQPAAPKRVGKSKAPSARGQDAARPERSEILGESPTEQRLQRIEERLEKMACILEESLPTANALDIPPSRASRADHNSALHDISLLPAELVEAEVQTYLAYFQDQPYCVFSKQWLSDRAGSLPPEIAFPLVALTSHVSRRSCEPPRREVPAAGYCANKARDILSSQYTGGQMGLSFLQGTFLMAQVDFADGRGHRGYANVALGLRTLQSAGLNKDKYASFIDPTEVEARRRITWAFFMLDRTYNASRNYSLCLSDKHFTLTFPDSNNEGPHQAGESQSTGTLHDGPGKQGEKVDHGILACVLRLYSLWGKATDFVFGPLDSDTLTPWQSGSAFAVLESEWLQFETQFADEHRYINVDFQRRAREDHEPRAYVSPWLCVQFLFHSIQCLLHHPFVIMTKLRHTNTNISATFLQKSHENSLLHSRWIARFVKETSEVDFQLYDPFLGYLAAIAATIQLEHTVSKNPRVALQVNNEFRTLVGFIRQLSTHWECMRVLVDRVNELAARHRNYGSLYYNRDAYSGALSSMPTPSNLPRMSAEDEAIMWDIFDFGSSCTTAETAHLVDLLGSNDQLAATDFLEPANSTAARRTPHSRGEHQRTPGAPDFSVSLPGRRASESVDGNPISDWPLPDADDGFWMPDIPEWMILGSDMGQDL